MPWSGDASVRRCCVSEILISETPVGQLAAGFPLATRVFARYQIDYCCGGGRPLAEVCKSRGLDADAVLEEIRKEIEPAGTPPEKWADAPLHALIDHIVLAYHVPLREELERLEGMARKVVRVHGDKDPERLHALLKAFIDLKEELVDHMLKEEAILFPMIQRGVGTGISGPVAVMMREHNDAGASLQILRTLTDNYTAPEGACTTWRALWYGLEVLETTMHQHIHLENNILFPRAMAS